MKLPTIALVCLALTACGQPVRREKLEAGYVLTAIDRPEDLSICREIGHSTCAGGIGPTITAIGMDRRYIVAAQHPGNNKARIQYYFIDLKVSNSEVDGVTGPLSRAQFDTKSQELDLPRLNWTVDETYSLKRPFKLSNYWP